MKKLIIPALLLFALPSMAQTKVKNDSVRTENIQEVLISKKVFKKESDRFVYDISNAPVAKGSTAFEVLKQTPMISSTDESSLKIAGKNNAVIFINGRKSNMDADAVMDMLKNTPAENIQKIEVITTPGSEYQVESSDGIINIVLKKKSTDGFNGNMRMNSRVNKYSHHSAAFSGNYRKDKLGINGSISVSDGNSGQHYILGNSGPDASNLSRGNTNNPYFNLGGYLTVDYQLTDRSNLALNFNSWYNNNNESTGSLFNTTVAQANSIYTRTENFSDSKATNNSLNLNYELKLDDEGSKINANAAYLFYRKNQNSINTTHLSDANNSLLDIASELYQDTPQNIDNFSATLDYVKIMKNDFTISAGAHYNNTKTDNDSQNITYTYDYDSSGNLISKGEESSPNHYIYNENIYGIYATVDKKFSDKFAAKIGGRYEITNSIGESDNAQNPEMRYIKRAYNNFLPYLSLNYAVNNKNNISYAFSSRMWRPSFWELNPVKNVMTKYNYIQNNPFVKAASTYNQELTYMFKNSYFLVLNHSYIKDVINQVPLQRTIEEDGVKYQQLRYIRTNFGNKQEMSAVVGLNRSFFKNYLTTNFSIGVQHNRNNGSLNVDPTTGDEFPMYVNKRNSTSLVIQTSNTIRLDKSKTWYLGVNYFFVDKQQIELGTLKELMSLDLSLKKIWNNWTFAVNVTDVLNTHLIKITDKQDNGNYNFVDQKHYRRAGSLSIVYNFGNQKVKRVRNIENATDGIKSRTGN